MGNLIFAPIVSPSGLFTATILAVFKPRGPIRKGRAPTRTARPGDFAFAPRGSHHALANQSDAPARYVLVITPAGFERYFDLITADQTGVDPPRALKPRPHSTVVGPPIGGHRAGA
jgi:hypothetical protein